MANYTNYTNYMQLALAHVKFQALSSPQGLDALISLPHKLTVADGCFGVKSSGSNHLHHRTADCLPARSVSGHWNEAGMPARARVARRISTTLAIPVIIGAGRCGGGNGANQQ